MNCLVVDDEEMSRMLVKNFVEQTNSLNLIGVCASGTEAMEVLNKSDVDILFLDIEMPDMSGYDLIKTLVHPPEIVLITAKADHAVEAFNYNVADYLVKPISYARFLQAISKIKDNLRGLGRPKESPNDLYVRSDSKIVRISFDDIYYIEALADYIMIFTQKNKHIVHSTMKGFQNRLPSNKFARVHRSYIVNKDKVETIENLFVVMNKKYIPIGASYKEEFMKQLNLL